MICQYVDNRRKELCEEGVAIKKGLRELLNILNKRNILRAVATSTPKPIAEKATGAGWNKKMSFLLLSVQPM